MDELEACMIEFELNVDEEVEWMEINDLEQVVGGDHHEESIMYS